MNLRQFHQLSAVIATAWILSAPLARAIRVTAESTNTNVETRWILIESSSISVDTRDYVYLTVTANHGTVACGGQQVHDATAQLAFTPNSTVELAARTPDPGYLFSRWNQGNSEALFPLGARVTGFV